MVLGSHNSWSYSEPKKWWMKLIGFITKCQEDDIHDQYLCNEVKCFDLRLRFETDGTPVICYGPVVYNYTYYQLMGDLEWLHSRKDATIRLILDLSGIPQSQYDFQRKRFYNFYREILKPFNQIKYILGRDLPTWRKCIVTLSDGRVEEKYASGSRKSIYNWWPWLYAVTHNKKIRKEGTDKDILLIDFVDIK